MEILNKIFTKVDSVKFWKQLKRMESSTSVRGWDYRVCWKIEKLGKSYESPWEGFGTIEEATKDLLKWIEENI